MKVAIIGSGISGLVSAHLMQRIADVDIYEANDYPGGHTHTHKIERPHGNYNVDTGFIVFNDRTYPNFSKLIEQLGVNYQNTTMGFSVRDDQEELEYSGQSLNGMFAQRSNLFKPRMYKLINEIMRFNRSSKAFLSSDDMSMTLENYLLKENYSRRFIDSFIIPMGAAIWSSSPKDMRTFPAHFFIRFFHNHGFLNLRDRVTWRVIKDGSKSYVDALLGQFKGNLHLQSPVQSVTSSKDCVTVKVKDTALDYDHVIFACHSNQALKLIADPSEEESSVLGNMPYQRNTAILHTDETLLPKRKNAWASWNFLKRKEETLCVSYNMNMLQGIDAPETFIVSLNCDGIDENKILKRLEYSHPLFTTEFVNAQNKWTEINGHARRWFCGAYWRNGFHEDGVVSALRVCDAFGVGL